LSLTLGTRLGVYQITAPLGEGGMGQVWRARDTKLDRDIAIKVLPEAFAHDAERLARFTREAKTLAALNHPNIAAIYGLEESGGITALVMELVEGDDLSQRIAKGAIPIDEALPIAKQVAEALEAAHEQGIIHRDLKPANIKVRPDGTVKVLDFGLAKAMDSASGSRLQASGEPANSPTITTPAMTQAGMILGTAAYMAPEQARGKTVDRRADIWAFGAVLFEMLTGTRAFPGEDITDTIVSVVSKEPDFAALPVMVPARVVQALRVCLRKDAKQRAQAIGDVRLALEGAFETVAPETTSSAMSVAPQSRLAWTAFAVALLGALVLAIPAVRHLREAPPPAPLVRSAMLPPPDVTVNDYSLAVSPDGTRIAFVGQDRDGTRRVWVRPLDAAAAEPLAGTEGARDPFWSPDGQSIGFFTDGTLKRIDAAGGPALAVADTGQGAIQSRGASWGAGAIVFQPGGGQKLQRVPDTGGGVTDATALAEGEATHRRPFFLPDGRHFVFSAGAGNSAAPKAIRLGSLDGPDSTVLIPEADSGATYASGYLLYVRGGTLMAQPFDVERLALAERARPVAENVPGGDIATVAGFSAAQGLLVHASGRLDSDLTWFDRQGNRLGTLGEPARFNALTLSPDRRSLSVTIYGQDGLASWLVDVARGLRTRVTSHSVVVTPGLSPDGRVAFFASTVNNVRGIFRTPVNGAGAEELLIEGNIDGVTISPDGRAVLYQVGGTPWLLPEPLGPPGSSKPRLLGFSGGGLQVSPDGRSVAYQSTETGRAEVYVRPFPGPGASRQISIAGGNWARWRGDGKEMFFVAPDGRIAVAEVSVRNGSLDSSEPRMLFDPQTSSIPNYTYDVSADGQRILAIVPRRTAGDGLTIVQNWPALLKP
jgi:eukaryotic-like serine/threonine-protein kinase